MGREVGDVILSFLGFIGPAGGAGFIDRGAVLFVLLLLKSPFFFLPLGQLLQDTYIYIHTYIYIYTYT